MRISLTTGPVASHDTSCSLHHFKAFGLRVFSDLAFTDVWPDTGPADVHIKLVDRTPVDVVPLHCDLSGPCSIHVPGVVNLYVRDGVEILVQPVAPLPSHLVEAYVLGPAMGALLHQRGDWPVHGSAILTSRGAVVFSGSSGSGKSTLAGALAQRGYRVLADDLCAISWGSPPRISPARPCIMLREDAMCRLGIGMTSLFRSVHASINKCIVPLDQPGPDAAVPIYAFYFLSQSRASSGITLSSISGARKLKLLAAGTYRKGVVIDSVNAAFQLRQMMGFADIVRVSTVEMRTDVSVLHQLCDCLEADFTKSPCSF